jgi:hypothetical protein
LRKYRLFYSTTTSPLSRFKYNRDFNGTFSPSAGYALGAKAVVEQFSPGAPCVTGEFIAHFAWKTQAIVGCLKNTLK